MFSCKERQSMYGSKTWRRWIVASCIGMLLPLGAVNAETEVTVGWPGARQAEYLNRGLVAVNTDTGVFLSWRLLGNESYGTAFNIYRNGRKLNPRPITDSTNFVDRARIELSSVTIDI